MEPVPWDAFIEERAVIGRILVHLRLWEEPQARPPPIAETPPASPKLTILPLKE